MKTIHHLVDVDAPSERVWRALTDATELASWWSTKVDVPDADVGTQIVWTFAGDFNPVMEITVADEGKELVWKCVRGHDPWQSSLFRFTLEPYEANRCRLRFWQDYAVELSDDLYGTYNFNWGYYLESIRLLCTTGTGKPFRPEG